MSSDFYLDYERLNQEIGSIAYPKETHKDLFDCMWGYPIEKSKKPYPFLFRWMRVESADKVLLGSMNRFDADQIVIPGKNEKFEIDLIDEDGTTVSLQKSEYIKVSYQQAGQIGLKIKGASDYEISLAAGAKSKITAKKIIATSSKTDVGEARDELITKINEWSRLYNEGIRADRGGSFENEEFKCTITLFKRNEDPRLEEYIYDEVDEKFELSSSNMAFVEMGPGRSLRKIGTDFTALTSDSMRSEIEQYDKKRNFKIASRFLFHKVPSLLYGADLGDNRFKGKVGLEGQIAEFCDHLIEEIYPVICSDYFGPETDAHITDETLQEGVGLPEESFVSKVITNVTFVCDDLLSGKLINSLFLEGQRVSSGELVKMLVPYLIPIIEYLAEARSGRALIVAGIAAGTPSETIMKGASSLGDVNSNGEVLNLEFSVNGEDYLSNNAKVGGNTPVFRKVNAGLYRITKDEVTGKEVRKKIAFKKDCFNTARPTESEKNTVKYTGHFVEDGCFVKAKISDPGSEDEYQFEWQPRTGEGRISVHVYRPDEEGKTDNGLKSPRDTAFYAFDSGLESKAVARESGINEVSRGRDGKTFILTEEQKPAYGGTDQRTAQSRNPETGEKVANLQIHYAEDHTYWMSWDEDEQIKHNELEVEPDEVKDVVSNTASDTYPLLGEKWQITLFGRTTGNEWETVGLVSSNLPPGYKRNALLRPESAKVKNAITVLSAVSPPPIPFKTSSLNPNATKTLSIVKDAIQDSWKIECEIDKVAWTYPEKTKPAIYPYWYRHGISKIIFMVFRRVPEVEILKKDDIRLVSFGNEDLDYLKYTGWYRKLREKGWILAGADEGTINKEIKYSTGGLEGSWRYMVVAVAKRPSDFCYQVNPDCNEFPVVEIVEGAGRRTGDLTEEKPRPLLADPKVVDPAESVPLKFEYSEPSFTNEVFAPAFKLPPAPKLEFKDEC